MRLENKSAEGIMPATVWSCQFAFLDPCEWDKSPNAGSDSIRRFYPEILARITSGNGLAVHSLLEMNAGPNADNHRAQRKASPVGF